MPSFVLLVCLLLFSALGPQEFSVVSVSVTDTSVKYLNTTLVESFEEIAPDWFLFTTKSGSHYIVQVDPDYLLYKLSDDPNANF